MKTFTQHTCAICHKSSCKSHCPWCGAYHFTVESRAVYVNRFFVMMVRAGRSSRPSAHPFNRAMEIRETTLLARRMFGHIFTVSQ